MKCLPDNTLQRARLIQPWPVQVSCCSMQHSAPEIDLGVPVEEPLYRALLEASPMPNFIIAAKDLRFVEVNWQAVEHYGFSVAEFLQMTMNDLIPGWHEAASHDGQAGCETTPDDRAAQTVRHQKKNGQIIYVEFASRQIRFRGEPCLLVVVHDITQTLKLQRALSREKVRHQVEITKATIHTQEKERAELGKELHDNVNQMLATVKLYLDTALRSEGNNMELVTRGRELVARSIEEVRRISKSLVPPSLGILTLEDALDELADSIRITGRVVRIHISCLEESSLKVDLKISIYRIIQEQLNNIIRHANASNVEIRMQQYKKTLYLEINDNGCGFTPSEHRNGIGITNIINRASLFKGKVEIVSAPGKGCSMQVTFRL